MIGFDGCLEATRISGPTDRPCVYNYLNSILFRLAFYYVTFFYVKKGQIETDG